MAGKRKLKLYQIYTVVTVEADGREQMEWALAKVNAAVREVAASLESTGGYGFPDGHGAASFEKMEED